MTDQTKALTKYDQFKITLRSDAVRERFETILGEKAVPFMSSLLSVVANDDALQKCDPASILTSAAKAAILDLPVEKSLGFAWIVPFGNKAEFIMGYKGYIQLALRTSFYEAINATPIYEGEEVEVNRLTGNITLDGNRDGDEVIGYASYFKMKNGFEKYIYMSVDDVHAHAKKYSKSYGNKHSAWTTNFDDMGKKTTIRQLLGKWGLLSIEMQTSDFDIDFPQDDGRLTQSEDMVVPEFGDVIEGEAVDPEPAKDEINHKRPYPPEIVRERISDWAQTEFSNARGSDKMRSLLRYGLELCFAGEEEIDDKRHTVLMYLAGTESTREVDAPTMKAILDKWLDVQKDNDTGDYTISVDAINEAHAIFTAALAGEGQAPLGF